MSTDAKNLNKCAGGLYLSARFYGCSYPHVHQILIIRGLNERKQETDAIFAIFLFAKSCPCSMDITGLLVTCRKLRDLTSLHVCPSFKNPSSAKCATAASSILVILVFYNHNKIWYDSSFNNIICPNELFKYSLFLCVVLMCVVPTVLRYLCLCVVLFQLWATWLLTQHVSKQELNWIGIYCHCSAAVFTWSQWQWY
jgi:hypothetical protein